MTRARPGLLVGISIGWIPLAFLFDGVTVLILPLRLGGSATQLGIVSFVGLALGALLQPLVGRLSDRFRGRIDRRAFIAVAAVPAIAGVWLLTGSSGALAALVGYVVIQAAAATVQAGQQTLIPEHVDAGNRGRASGLKAAFDVGGAFVAFLVLGAVLAAGDIGPAAIAITVVVAGATLLMLMTVPRDRTLAFVPSPVSRRMLDLPPGLAALIAGRFLFLIGTYAVGRFLLLLVADRLDIAVAGAADEAGGLLALFTLTTAAAAIVCGWLADRISLRDLMLAGAVVSAVGILVLVPAAGLAGLLAGGLLMSIGTAGFITANWAATVAVVPAPDAGRLMGIANLGTALAAAIAGLVGVLIDLVGFSPALVAAAAVSAAAVLPIVASSRRPAHLTEARI